MAKAKTKKKYKSFHELRDACDNGDVEARALVIRALINLGGEHLASGSGEPWERSYRGLQNYINALIAEYGQDETDAEIGVLAEVNHLID